MKAMSVTKKEDNRNRAQKYRDTAKEEYRQLRETSYAEFTEITAYICIDCGKRIRHYYDWDECLGRIYEFRGRFRCKYCLFLLGERSQSDTDMGNDYIFHGDGKVGGIDYFGNKEENNGSEFAFSKKQRDHS